MRAFAATAAGVSAALAVVRRRCRCLVGARRRHGERGGGQDQPECGCGAACGDRGHQCGVLSSAVRGAGRRSRDPTDHTVPTSSEESRHCTGRRSDGRARACVPRVTRVRSAGAAPAYAGCSGLRRRGSGVHERHHAVPDLRGEGDHGGGATDASVDRPPVDHPLQVGVRPATTRHSRSPVPVIGVHLEHLGDRGQPRPDVVVAGLAISRVTKAVTGKPSAAVSTSGPQPVTTPLALELVEPGLHGAAGQPQPSAGLQHARPGAPGVTAPRIAASIWSTRRVSWTSRPLFPEKLDDLISNPGRTIVPIDHPVVDGLGDLPMCAARHSALMTQTATRPAPAAVAADPFPVHGMDAIVFAVGNAKQAAHWYSTAFGMTGGGLPRPGAGRPRRRDVRAGLRSGALRARRPRARRGALAARGATHGDGIMDLALEVPDVPAAYAYAIATAPGAWRSRTRSATRTAPSWSARPSRPTATLGTR